MAKSEKIGVTIDGDSLTEAEALRRRTRESRSALMARALRRLLAEERRQEAARRYVEVHRAHPESAEDVAEAHRLAEASLALVPWDDDET